ncbi:hypothetical protein QBC35DRAFT_442582 [Podospora australis]|uniref:Ankyrin repeat protein n=1 Tax=Podospora australis TaxID=1536484 RepID=A0AAN6WM60_9PEZI|nr:hypothetical protein QBC35DRAFT_442582 [Podospora australis]
MVASPTQAADDGGKLRPAGLPTETPGSTANSNNDPADIGASAQNNAVLNPESPSSGSPVIVLGEGEKHEQTPPINPGKGSVTSKVDVQGSEGPGVKILEPKDISGRLGSAFRKAVQRTQSSSGGQRVRGTSSRIEDDKGTKKAAEEKDKSDLKSPERRLHVLFDPSNEASSSLQTSFDIVAVHDIMQSVETAWGYHPEHESSRRKPTPHAQEQVPSMTTAISQIAGQQQGASNKSQPQRKEPISDTDTTMTPSTNAAKTENKNEKNLDIAESTTQPRSRANSSVVSRPESPKPGGMSSWLSDHTMLRGQFSRARVMAFGYQPPKVPPNVLSEADGARFDEALTNLGKALVGDLTQCRKEGGHEIRPVVFIGMGFGCLIIQKALILITEGEEVGPQAILNMTAGVLFIDAPVPLPKKPPKEEESKKDDHSVDPATQHLSDDTVKKEDVAGKKNEEDQPKSAFPKVANRNSRWVKALLEPRHIDSGCLWERFQSTAKASELYTAWFYDPVPKSPRPYVDGILFIPFMNQATKSNRSVTQMFQGPRDINYVHLVEQVRHSLFFKAASETKLDDLLEELINDNRKLSDAVKDFRGRCPAHRAISSVNFRALERLLSAYPALAESQDSKGWTPLHIAVCDAAMLETNADDDKKRPLRNMIEKLFTALEQLNSFDDPKALDGKTPWDHLDAEDNRHAWVKQLRNRKRLLIAKAARDEGVPQLVPPKDQDKITACKKTDATLIQFYIATDGTADYIDRQRPTVHQVLYDEADGPDKLFRRNLQQHEDKRPTCRWIHLPANNEEWVQDLFLRLRRIDNSLAERRHQGTAKWDRHINADVERYNQIHQPISKGGADTSSPLPSPQLQSDTETARQETSPPFAQPSQSAIPKERPEFDRNPSSSSSIKSRTDPQSTRRLAYSIFMPILGFEKHRCRKRLTEAMTTRPRKLKTLSTKDETTRLIRGYFKDNSLSLHCRRTLDQFTYHMLGDTEKRDNDQVIFKWARKEYYRQRRRQRQKVGTGYETSIEDAFPVLMIDQLWLWILEDDDEPTVITCFPNTWESNLPYNMMHFLENHIMNNNNRDVIKCPMDLANEIIRCGVDFLRRKGPMGHSVQGCFQSSINDVALSQARRFEKFEELVKQLTGAKRKQIDKNEQADLTDKLFRLTKETALLVEILDIQDELKIIQDVFAKQEEVLKKFHSLVSTYAERKSKDEKTYQSTGSVSMTEILSGSGKSVHFADQRLSRRPEGKPKELVKDNLGLVRTNIEAVAEMTTYADKMRVELNGLLDLKQKQANAWEARFSREGSESSQRQGNITMVFTIVTIFFLPLSFMSSVFSIQVDASPKDPVTGEAAWPIGMIMGLLCNIPLAIVAFRVNKISAKLLPWLSWLSSRRSKQDETSTLAPSDNDEEDDEDNNPADNDSDSESTSTAPSTTRHSQYAPIFNRWHFHERIPILRLLWRYQVYANEDRWDEEVERDYPLHRGVVFVRGLRRRFIVDPLLKLAPIVMRKKVERDRRRKDFLRQVRKMKREEKLRREELWWGLDDRYMGGSARYRGRDNDMEWV